MKALAGLFDAAPDALLCVSRDGRVLYANRAAEVLLGRRDLVGRPHHELLPARHRAAHTLHVAGYQASPHARPMGAPTSDVVALRGDGVEVPVEVSLAPAEADGAPVVLVFVRDATEKRRAAAALRERDELVRHVDRFRILADASAAFAEAALDFDALFDAIARSASETIGDAAIVNLLSDDGGSLRSVAARMSDPALERDFRAMLEAASPRVGEGVAGRVIAENVTVLLPEVDADRLVADARPEWRDVVRRMNVRSLLVVPMRVRGVPIGSFSVFRNRPGSPYVADDESLLQHLADRAALAVENARLHADLERRVASRTVDLEAAVASLRASEERFRFLAEVSEVLASTLDYEVTLRRVARLAVRHLADYCMVWAHEDDDLRVVAHAHRDLALEPRVAQLAREYRFRLDDPRSLLARVVRTRRSANTSTYVPVRDAPAGMSPATTKVLDELAPSAVVNVPVVLRDRLFGVLMFARSGVPFAPHEVELAEELARRAAFAIENADLYERAEAARHAAETATSMRDDVLAVVAHDLGGPLAAIELMAGRLAGAAEPADAIRRSARHMSGLVRDLVDVASIEAGHLRLDVGPVEAAAVIVECVEAFASLADKKRVALSPALVDRDVIVTCDRRRLRQVLDNLVANAIKFTPPGGSVTVGMSTEGDRVTFSVLDSGEGIAAGDRARVFDRHWRATREGGGLGLGLYVARQIVEAHRGRIWADEAPGGGAALRVSIPR